ncbi:RNA polymerase sigma factor [Roseiconus lacunae]|uniref:Sigma-70 family RNA polymerase sigma factor n=1 Tax=Roseiconus lacunae TaxID=2605694 RepID=A0ABT7PRG2_9BACT|nr:sigma-70 family RNA polymerase sigma factor [Roseiconus lacunae]MDM4019093.1 sigma-70 family RNA polymerase sigma factor [Roseiconus lacunae]
MSGNSPPADGSPPQPNPPGGPASPKNEIEAWNEVLEASRGGLRAFLSTKLPQAADVDDCLQAVSIAMLRMPPDVPPPARKAWLFRVAANQAALWWRKKSVADRALETALRSVPPAEAGQRHFADTDPLETAEVRQRVRQAIERLPESTRKIVRLRLRDGKPFREIAEQLDIPLGTALTRMRRAMDQLRIELNDLHELD